MQVIDKPFDGGNIINLYDDVIFKLLDEVSHEDEIWDLVHNCFVRFGALDTSYYHLSPAGSFDFDKKFFVCRGRDFVDINAYLADVFVDGESFLPKIRLLDSPVFFSKFCALKTLTERQFEIMKSFHHDVTPNGVIMPVHGALGRSGCFVIGFADENRKHTGAEIRYMSWVCQAAHQIYCRLRADSERHRKVLSRREKEILSWVARGKSNSVIAEIIGISPHTVNGYLRSIYLKTATSDRTTASLRGISEALIDF